MALDVLLHQVPFEDQPMVSAYKLLYVSRRFFGWFDDISNGAATAFPIVPCMACFGHLGCQLDWLSTALEPG